MKSTILMIFMLVCLAMPVFAQETEAPEGQTVENIDALRAQLVTMIKARGEDQKALGELKLQLAQLAAKIPAPDPAVTGKRAKQNLKQQCEGFGLRFDKLEVQFQGNDRILTLLCK